MERQLEADAALRRGRWIWVHHAPPADSPVSWGGSRHFGDTALVEWIGRFRPDLVLSGHVHQSPFVPGGSWIDRLGETWVFNTGQQPGDEPAHIAFELTEDHAIWLSTLAPAEAQKLSGELTRPVPAPDELPEWLRVAGRP